MSRLALGLDSLSGRPKKQVIFGPLTASVAHAILQLRKGEPHNMRKGTVTKFNVLTESRKVLRGKPTKVSEASLLHTLAGMFVEEHGKPAKKA
jgi:hypothetical protein